MAQKYRTIVLSKKAEKAVDELNDSMPGFADAYLGLEWLLARNPDVGKIVPVDGADDLRVHTQHTAAFAPTPIIEVNYNFTENEVTVISIRAFAYAKPKNNSENGI